jgi:hypothetical protein
MIAILVAVAASQAGKAFSVGPAHDVLGVNVPVVTLAGAVAKNVAVVAARALQHGCDLPESSDAPVAVIG